ncbi:hypothetical protein R3O67_30560 [Bacillus cereus]|uniref:hypothetical protein n=1 Tax=Bacillus cereus TaxID=1396 RepID=UPI003078F3D4
MTKMKIEDLPEDMQRKLQNIREKSTKTPGKKTKMKMEDLPESVQRMLKIMRGEIELPPRKRIKPRDFYSYEASEVFPNSPDMQRYFNKMKHKEMERRKYVGEIKNRY